MVGPMGKSEGLCHCTIALQSRAGVSLLEGIAADNNGTFKFVK